ncbi:MAG: SWF/SNF helicase family protein [Chloroflexi bacterium]|nr:SWF/SNF helicase family protein [Chloroflexota bacterium]MYF22713.1 SWF/SNF helicase family protein [Chloroflexota bacterium]
MPDAVLRNHRTNHWRAGCAERRTSGSEGGRRNSAPTGVTRRLPTLLKARGSAQGLSAGILADACGKSLALSGTLMGGYASTLFHLLYRFSPEIRSEFGRSDERKWVERYGFLEQRVRHDRDDDPTEDGSVSRRRSYRKHEKERPGMAPAALFHLIGHSLFLRLADVASGLPPYEEQIQVASMDTEEGIHSLSQASAYRILATDLKRALLKAIERGSQRLLSTYLQALLAYPEGCTRGESVFDPDTGDLIVQLPPLDPERVYPKERQLIDLVAQERLAGRRVLVYATHTGRRDITGRLETLLTRHGFKTAVMKADRVQPKQREAWVAKRVEEGIDVLICHPRLVQTGLDLIQFPTLVWYETDYSVYTMRQASRRLWRIGQHRPVKVVFMAYRNTLQADALKLVAQKLQSSLAVEGDLPEDGLAAYGDTGDDLMMALARKLVSGETDSEPVEDIFLRAQQIAAEAEDLLVDADWERPIVEPAPLVALPSGEAEAVVELVPCSSHHGQDEQQTLFSWAEFLAEQTDEPKPRGRNTPPSGPSLFDWALEREQEAGLVAAGG